MLIHVVQGERELAKDCRSLARFDLKDIDPMPAGMARIEVRFLIDANGILNVTARDARTGKEQSVEVKPCYGLTHEQVEAMYQASIDHAEEDFKARRWRRRAWMRTAFSRRSRRPSRTTPTSNSPKMSAATSARALNDLLVVYHGDNHLLIRAKIDQLNSATMKLAENMINTAVTGALKGTKI